MQKKEYQLHHFVNSLKYKFFKVIYLILKDWKPYKSITIIVCFVQYLQYTYLNFGLKIQYVWNNSDYSELMNLLLKYFTITISVKNLGINIYLGVFYLCFGIVIISILLFLLLGFVITNKKIQQFLLIFLRFLLKILLTFGFWPIVRMQFGLLACEQNKAGKYVMMFETSQQCWTSEYYIHAIIAMIGLIITLSFSVSIAFVTYESRKVLNDSSAMRNGRSYSLVLIYIFIQIMAYQLLITPDYTQIIIIVFFIGSGSIFFNTHIEQPYYDSLIQKMWSILSGINFWTIIMMFYAYGIEGHIFSNSIKCWLLGIPLIIGILILRQREQIDLMIVNLKKFENGTEIIKLCEYLLYLTEEAQKNQRSQLLLDSYLELHREVCNRVDCVLKLKQELASKFKDNPKYTDRQYITKELILQLYRDGIKQFPEEIPLRMSFIYFLYDEKKPFSILMTELNQATEFKPTLDYEFHIYRYKTIVEEEFQLKAEQFDITSQQKQIKDQIDLLEHTGLLLIEFWILLTDDSPDMERLMNYGFKILRLRENIESQWRKLKNTHSIKLYFSMLKFYQLCLDDLEISEKLQNELYEIQKNKQQELSELEEVCNQSCPTIVSTASFQEIQVYVVNKAFCSSLGFSKTDLIGRSINQIIPEIFIKQHNLCVENFIENKIQNQEKVINQTVYLLTKSGYIVPMFANIKLLQANKGQLYFISQFTSNFTPKQQCILILDNEGYIQNISSSCIQLFKLDWIKIQVKKINIKHYFSDFMSKKDLLFSKGGTRLHLIPSGQKYSNKTLDTTSIYEQNEFQCYVQPIQYNCIDDKTVYGMIVRLELIKQIQNNNNNDQSILKFYPLKVRRTLFPIFMYAPPTTFYLEYQNITEFEESLNISQNQDNGTKLSKIVDYFRMAKRMSAPQKHFSFLDDGIKTKRLWEGQIIDIEEFAIDVESENSEQSEQIFSEKEKLNEVQEFQHYFELFQSKSTIYDVLIHSNISKTLKILHLLIKFQIFVLYISGFIVYMLNKDDDIQVSSLISKLSLNNKELSSCLMIQTIIQDLRILNQNIIPNLRNDIEMYRTENQLLLNIEVMEIQNIHKQLTGTNYQINDEYKEYKTKFQAKVVELYSLDGTSQNYTYSEAIEQLIAKAIILNSGDNNKFNDKDVDFYYFNYNIINSVSRNYQSPLDYLYYSIKSVTANSLENKVIFLIVQTFLAFITYVIITFYLTLYNKSLHELYFLFLDVNPNQLKVIVQKCEQFLTLLSIGDEEEEENIEQNVNKIQHEQDLFDINRKKNKKAWKNSNKYFLRMMASLFFIFAFFEIYFIFQYKSAQLIVEDTENLSPILNTTSLLESRFRFGDNILREYFINPKQKILTNSNSYEFINNYFLLLYNANAEMQTAFTQNTDLFQQDFIDAFQQLYVTNPCPIVATIQNFITQERCETFYDGIVSEGLSVALVKYLENLNILLLYYNEYQIYLESQNLNDQTKNDQLLEYAILLSNSTLSLETRLMQKIVIRYSQSYLISKLEISIQDSFNKLSSIRNILFICFTFYIFIIVLFLWIPANNSLIKLLRRSRTLLLVLPMEILTNSIQIRRYIRGILKN